MPAILGAATADDITLSTNGTHGTATISLTYGWWRPTTLTATRGLWSNAAITGAEIDSTTSELRLRTDNTTDGQWTTTGVGLVVDEWKFLAFLRSSNNTGPAGAWRVWAGTINTAPVEVTVAVAVAPAGNFVSATDITFGNKGIGTLAFQGEIGNVGEIGTGSGGGVTANVFGIAAFGAITNEEAQWIAEQYVLPIWHGDYSLRHIKRQVNIEHWHFSCDHDFVVVGESRESPSTLQPRAPTVNGATYSATRDPRGARNLAAPPLVRR